MGRALVDDDDEQDYGCGGGATAKGVESDAGERWNGGDHDGEDDGAASAPLTLLRNTPDNCTVETD
eukprot:9090167-Pyramimonas_sp.AAC.1